MGNSPAYSGQFGGIRYYRVGFFFPGIIFFPSMVSFTESSTAIGQKSFPVAMTMV